MITKLFGFFELEFKQLSEFKLDFFLFWMEAVSYTHLRAHETDSYLVCRLLLEKIFFFNDTATTEIYT